MSPLLSQTSCHGLQKVIGSFVVVVVVAVVDVVVGPVFVVVVVDVVVVVGGTPLLEIITSAQFLNSSW